MTSDPRRDDPPVTGFGFFGTLYDVAVSASPWSHGKSLVILGLGLLMLWLGYLDGNRLFMGLSSVVVLVGLVWLVTGIRADWAARRLSQRYRD